MDRITLLLNSLIDEIQKKIDNNPNDIHLTIMYGMLSDLRLKHLTNK